MKSHVERNGLSFDEIAEKHGEEAAIEAGIAADPDAVELDEEWFRRARPAREVLPHLVEGRGAAKEAFLHVIEHQGARRGRRKRPAKRRVSLRLDADLRAHFRKDGRRGWETRLNDTLRKAVFGSE